MTVFNKQATQRFWDAMRTRRVDFVDISDSNCLFGGHGRNHGLSYAFSTLGIPIYRTQVFSAAENRNVGSSSGYKSGAINDGGRLNRIGNAPAELDMYMPDNGTPTGEGQWAPSHNYWYLRSGDTYTNGNNGIVIDADNPVGVNGNLRAWFTYGELADVSGGAGTSNRFDYGNHANKIELTSDLDYDNFTLPSSHPCARAGAVNIGVEYDRFWRLRNLSAPSIGPVEAL